MLWYSQSFPVLFSLCWDPYECWLILKKCFKVKKDFFLIFSFFEFTTWPWAWLFCLRTKKNLKKIFKKILICHDHLVISLLLLLFHLSIKKGKWKYHALNQGALNSGAGMQSSCLRSYLHFYLEKWHQDWSSRSC